MVAAARLAPNTAPVSSPRDPASTTAPTAATSTPSTTTVSSPRDPASTTTDSFARTSGPSSAPSPSAAAPVQGDPELARQARLQMQTAHATTAPLGLDRTLPSPVRNDAGDLLPGQVAPRQAAVRAEMEAATGAAPHDPPTEAEVRSYFRTFRDRPAADAVAACERYQDAYQRHDGSHDYGSVSTTYATDPGARGTPRILPDAAAAEREHRAGRNTTSIPNDAPNDFAEANHRRGSDGRANMDCEGFAVSSAELLREAGFSQRQAVGTFPDGSGHSAAIVSRNGQSWVMSNGDAYRVTGRGDAGTRAALDRAFDATVAEGVPSTYYTGRTQDEAGAREVLGLAAGRIR